MLALQILNLKNFMGRLLTGNCFDIFLLEEASISTINTFTIDGHINTEFFTKDSFSDDTAHREAMPDYDFRPWSEIRSLCFDLIKGKRTPLAFKFVLHLKPEFADRVLSDAFVSAKDSVRSLVLGIRYDKGNVIATTATAFNTFVMDKTPDRVWDDFILEFFNSKDISYEVL